MKTPAGCAKSGQIWLVRHKGKERGGKSQARKSVRICWHRDLTATAGASLPPPFPEDREPPARRCQGGVTCVTWNGHEEPPDGPAGCRSPGAEAESCRGCSPQSPGRGWPPSPPSPPHRSILAPIDGRFPAAEGRCCPAGQEKWLFAEPGAGSSIDLWCLVRDQLGPSLTVPRAKREPELGREQGNARLGTRCPGAAQPAHPHTLPCLSFPEQSWARSCSSMTESLVIVPGLGEPRGSLVAGLFLAHPPDGNVCLSIPSEPRRGRSWPRSRKGLGRSVAVLGADK